MPLSRLALLYLLTIPVFAVVDLLWLGYLSRGFYKENLGHLLSPEVNWGAAGTFYLLYIGGILYFAVLPGLAAQSLGKAALNGALFGFFTYITYELTNAATLPDWPFKVVVVDTLWGMTLCTVVAVASTRIGMALAG